MQIAAIILILILSCLLFWLLGRCQLNYLAKQQCLKPIRTPELVTSSIGCVICAAVCYWAIVKVHYCSVASVVVCILISLALTLLFYFKSRKFATLSKFCRLSHALMLLVVSSVIPMGVFPLCRWIFPDVTTISNEYGKYEVAASYAWPWSENLKPNGSYVVNNTGDTLYRVVVSYAFLGEETKNHYNITDTIDPKSTVRIPCPPNFVARRIYPVMMPSYGKTGRYRTRRSYIVNGGQLDAFEFGDFSTIGISENVRVPSFNLTSNPIIWEDSAKLEALDRVLNRFDRKKRNQAQ